MPNVQTVFGEDIVERVKYGALVLVGGLVVLTPHFLRTFEARALMIVCCFCFVLYCMREAIMELEVMAVVSPGGLKIGAAFAIGAMVVVGLTVAFILSVTDWRLYLILLLGTFATDSFALLGGRVARWLSRWWPEYRTHAMTKFSGGKTVEGLVVGLVLGWVLTYLALYTCGWLAGLVISPLLLLIVAFVPPVAIAGDYAESVLKRAFAVKDSGRILGPHGGMLDRLDSLSAVFIGPGLVLLFI